MQKDLKKQSDDDFEVEGELPFPKEMDDRVARLKLGNNQEKHPWMDDIASVDLSLMSDPDLYSDVPMRVTLKWRLGAFHHPHRVSYHFYTADYYPVCEDQQETKISNGRNRQMTHHILRFIFYEAKKRTFS